MGSSITALWNYGKEYCGIEHTTDGTGETRIIGLTAITKKGEYELNYRFEIQRPEELPSQLKKNQHCFLIINDSQVLLKSTATQGPEARIVASAFPNIDLNDFYYQIQRLKEINWVALCRKEHVKEVFMSYKSHKISIIGFSLGLLPVCRVLPIIQKETVYAAGYQFTINSKEVVSIEKTGTSVPEESYILGDTEVDNKFLIALSAIFHYTAVSEVDANNRAVNSELMKIHRQKVFFRKGIITGVAILLVALLLNFYLFSNYYSKLQTHLAVHNTEIAQQDAYQRKASQLTEKEKIVANIQANSTSKMTYYLNRTISTKPSSVLLSEFIFQPLRKQLKYNEAVEIEKDLIVLLGESREEVDFSSWIKELESTAWISEVTVSNYSYKEKKNSEFEIRLRLRQDETVE